MVGETEGAREKAEAALAQQDGGWLRGFLEVPVERSNYYSFSGRFRTLDGIEFSDVALYDPLLEPYVDFKAPEAHASQITIKKSIFLQSFDIEFLLSKTHF